jgi:hypothetical protein
MLPDQAQQEEDDVVTWFRIDDKFHEHRKVRALRGDKVAAVGLWTLCGDWAADNIETNVQDGFVPEEIVWRYDPDEVLAARLVDVKLWHPAEIEGERGYLFHQWDEHQPTRAQIQKRRDDSKQRVAAHRERKAEAARAKQVSNGTGNALLDLDVTQAVTPPPTRPDPSRPDRSSNEEPPDSLRSSGRAARAHRIPDDFAVTADMVEWARENCPDVDGRFETAQFRDYWAAASGQNAKKVDWRRAWQVWMRKAQQDGRGGASRAVAVPGPLGPRPSTTDQRVAAAQALKRQRAERRATGNVVQFPGAAS